jgi:hypothetical protein
MLARIGNVIYWAGCAFAGLVGLMTLPAAIEHPDWGTALSLVFMVFLIWLPGRAVLYILAGR